MGIVFFCQSCGARFEVDPRMAGKRGHCKKCGQVMAIPRAEEIASMAAIPALAMAGVGAGLSSGEGRPAGADGSSSVGSWLQAGLSNAVLAPITVDRMPLGQRKPTKPSPLDDAEDSKPYVLAQPLPKERGAVRSQDHVVLRVWRGQLGGIQRILRWVNETAYLISVPFIMMLLVGTMARNRPMALLGAAVVVLLNIGRLVTAGASLTVVPFRDGLKWKKLKKPLRRLAEPAMTIGLVVLAFLFIPFLSTGKTSTKGVAGKINAGLEALEKRSLGEVEKARPIEEGQTRP
jgi:hypothetical protein